MDKFPRSPHSSWGRSSGRFSSNWEAWVVALFTCDLCGGLGGGEIGLSHTHRATTHLAHKNSFLQLFVCFPFLSFGFLAHVWYVSKLRQGSIVKKLRFSPKSPIQNSPWSPRFLGRDQRAAQAAWGGSSSQRRELGRLGPVAGRLPRGFPLCPSSLAGSTFCLRWNLYLTPWVLGREQG